MVTNMCVKFGEDWTNSFQELDRKQSSGRTYGQGQPYMPPLCGAIKNKEGYSINFIKDKFNSMLKNKEGYSINFIKDKFNSMLKNKEGYSINFIKDKFNSMLKPGKVSP